MTSLDFSAQPPRLSDAEREFALELLRDAAVRGRVSQDTFEGRAELILKAQRPDELHAVLYDLRPLKEAPPARENVLVRVVGGMAALRAKLRRAWRTEELPELQLPASGPYALSIGRAPGSVLRLTDHTVSRAHAQVRFTGSGWTLRDLGSSNGTWVNDRRITGSVPVRPGDRVRFGQVGFRLTSP
ncbi:FHA domain-containing protein [Streptomyces alkaliterrae]|uniref:FHA domain-containing protein n=1 Tax=Streptomyces alkaliterrae TaxID=2213162 RepID=A0A5P0YW03_9ACTN|nr:FHA domain-containing protein [Streptomyces alkaliterrae]MBB1256006.1 FHA domain-containing protein [Streptomyces alkaliterrae]MBB1262010.1 FHA domain-containing protein [Streptomyces alkaliterrae]MQS04475.1 FHA domain-containing protein [Streptomyces alkaliterrae]